VAEVIDRDPPSGGRVLRFLVPENRPLLEILDNYGEIPFPPYVTASEATVEQYQTVYAQDPGSVAAPTAGLHFTPELLQTLLDRGINQATVTLHVGVGTFRPVTVEDITQHEMHSEWLTVSAETVEQVLATKAQGGRVFAVGTTTVRCLETAVQDGEMRPYSGQTNIFIYPGYQWRLVDGLITNFHLPGSSLMMLVGALIGRQRLLELYEIAIAEGYRFYSFGDAMLILPT
jgi:S-adenosylmethionine:tRNA ribosyltransferase-isomerase